MSLKSGWDARFACSVFRGLSSWGELNSLGSKAEKLLLYEKKFINSAIPKVLHKSYKFGARFQFESQELTAKYLDILKDVHSMDIPSDSSWHIHVFQFRAPELSQRDQISKKKKTRLVILLLATHLLFHVFAFGKQKVLLVPGLSCDPQVRVPCGPQ